MEAIRAETSESRTYDSIGPNGYAWQDIAKGSDFALIVSCSVHIRATITSTDTASWEPVTILSTPYVPIALRMSGHRDYKVTVYNRDGLPADIHIAVLREAPSPLT